MIEIKDIESSTHEQVVYCSDSESNLRAIIAVHNTARGPSLGGCRMWSYKTEQEALTDVLRLSKGMTYKAAIANLKLGGGKSVIIGDAKKDKTQELFKSFGQFVDTFNGSYITAEDVGTTEDDMELVRRETKHVTGVSKKHGGSGDPSPFTAYGTYLGIKASVKYKMGISSLDSLKIVVQGIGSVGESLVSYLCDEGADVYINDIDEAKLDNISNVYNVKIIHSDDLYSFNGDVYSPCALGATINNNTINQLQYSIIAGAANNILLDPKKHGDELMKKNILFAPDYVINAGGLINVASEIDGYNENEVRNKIEQIHDTLLNIYDISRENGISTSSASSKLAKQIIFAKHQSELSEID